MKYLQSNTVCVGLFSYEKRYFDDLFLLVHERLMFCQNYVNHAIIGEKGKYFTNQIIYFYLLGFLVLMGKLYATHD